MPQSDLGAFASEAARHPVFRGDDPLATVRGSGMVLG